MTIVPGTYRIKNAESWTTFDQSRKNHNVIHGWQERTDQQNQHWYVQPLGGDGAFHIKNVETGQYASVDGGYNSSKIHASGNPSTWYLPQEGDGSVFITLAGTNYVVDLDMGKKDNGTTIHLWEKTGAKQQKWFFEKINDNSGQHQQPYQQQPHQQQQPPQQQPQQTYQPPPQQQQQPPQQPQQPQQPQEPPCPVSPGTYFLKNVKTGTVIDLSRGESNEGADVFGYDHNGGNNQKWQLQPSGHGQRMTLRNVQTNTYASFPGQSFAQGVLVKASNQAQEYTIVAADRGFYIQPVQQPGYVLDLVHGSDKNGTKICVWQNNQQDNQKWYFERA
jgi:hypothetical protein